MHAYKFTDEDVISFDLLTFSYRNIVLIRDLTNDLESEVKNDQQGAATKFYFPWCDKRLKGKHQTPFNPGTVWMITSAIIVTSKERWLNLLPDTPIQESDQDWSLKDAQLHYPSYPNPTIRDVIHKIRNSISHSDFSVHVGDFTLPWEQLLKESYFIFRDTRTRSRSGIYFEIKISMFNLWDLNVQIYSTIQKAIEAYRGINLRE